MEPLLDWRTPFFRELDPEYLTEDLEDEVFERECAVELRPTVSHDSEWFYGIRWQADFGPGSSADAWECQGRTVFSADPHSFVAQLVELSTLHYQCRALIDEWQRSRARTTGAALT